MKLMDMRALHRNFFWYALIVPTPHKKERRQRKKAVVGNKHENRVEEVITFY